MKKICVTMVVAIMIILFYSCEKSTNAKQFVCPTVKEAQEKLKDVLNIGKIIKVEKTPILNLCEVVIELPNQRKTVFYVDSKVRYIVLGKILDIKAKKDLTAQKIALLNKRYFPVSKFKELDKLVAFTYGDKGETIYYIVDPDCPFCKKAEKIIKKLADEGKVRVKVILYPLEGLHPKAKEKAISLICGNKGLNELISGNYSKTFCEEGKKKVKETISYMQKHKITATPTIIYPDGEIRTGVQSEKHIIQKLKSIK